MDPPRGTGPGDITADGCAVDLYALLPSFGEPEIVHSAVPAGASILELGCGTGRIREDTPGIRMVIRSARRVPPRMHAEVEYHAGGRVWTHAWGSYEIGGEELEGDLSLAGLRFGRWLTDGQSWFTARPA